MSDIQEEQKRLYKRAEENDYIVKDIAQYEENDSNLAKHTIMELQEENKRLKELNEVYKTEIGARGEDLLKKEVIINKAIEFLCNPLNYMEITGNFERVLINGEQLRKLYKILKGDNK